MLMNLDHESIHLWCANPADALVESTAEACASLLSEDERIRWKRFRFDRQQREFLTTRALVRTALSRYFPLAPEAWRFKLNRYGKPDIDPDRGLQFNLSNSPALVVCLIARQAAVGVDVEPIARAEKIVEVAREVFSPLEMAEFQQLQGRERLDRAVSLWTLKESYIKARGMGLSLPLKKFSFLFGGPEGIRLHLDSSLCDDAGRWRFCLMDHAGHRVAMMVERAAAPKLQLWEQRPLLSDGSRMALGQVQWFPNSTASR